MKKNMEKNGKNGKNMEKMEKTWKKWKKHGGTKFGKTVVN